LALIIHKEALQPAPCIPHPMTYTLNPEFLNLNPIPYSLNPKP